MSSSAPPPPPPASGWASLPHDVLWSAFTVLGQREILSGAGLACVAWWRFGRDEPALWRRIDLRTSAPRDEDDDEDEYVSDDDSTLFRSFDDDDPSPINEEKLPAKDDFTVEGGDDGDLSDSDDESLSDDHPVPVCEKTPAKVFDDSSGWKAMALAAVDRSAGQCEAFWGRADDEVLLYLAGRFGLTSFSLRCIHIWGSNLLLLLLLQ